MQEDQRREQRRNTTGTYSICWPDTTGQMKSAEVQARDASKLGMRITCPVGLPLGTTVYIEGRDGQIRGYCTVRHCAGSGQNYSIGVEYDGETRARLEVQSGPDIDYYEFLQISPKAESGTIQRIYRFMAGRFHPDNPATGDPEKFLLLKQAYEVLSDPDRRAQYDAERDAHDHDIRPNPIFELSEFVNGIEGEVNRRLGVLSLLYNQRRTNSDNPAISLYDIEKRMGWPREYLNFTTWYLRSMRYITCADNSDFTLTALGADYVEQNYTKIPILKKLLDSGTRTATSAGATSANGTSAKTFAELLLMPAADSPATDTSHTNGAAYDDSRLKQR